MIAPISKLTRYHKSRKDMHDPATEQSAPVIPSNIELPKGATLSGTALVFGPDTSEDEWKALGIRLATFNGGMRWWCGDWWHYGDHKYGERAELMAKGAFPYKFETLINWGYVAGKVSTSLRNEDLSWSHHNVVAPYKPEEQEKWLKRAVKLNLSVAKLRQHIYEKEQDDKTDDDRAREWVIRLEKASKSWEYFDPIETGWISLQSSEARQDLADKCDEASKRWAAARDQIRAPVKKVVSKRQRKKKEDDEWENAAPKADDSAAPP